VEYHNLLGVSDEITTIRGMVDFRFVEKISERFNRSVIRWLRNSAGGRIKTDVAFSLIYWSACRDFDPEN
jgi:hypothetical protein